jgi:hypothetical protein
MRYRVAFARREPSAEFDLNLSEGVVAEKALIKQVESDTRHSQEALEVWDYEVVDGHAMEFEDALMNSDRVLEYEIIDMATDGGERSEAPTGRGMKSLWKEAGSF